jgi:hypothetical protein
MFLPAAYIPNANRFHPVDTAAAARSRSSLACRGDNQSETPACAPVLAASIRYYELTARAQDM